MPDRFWVGGSGTWNTSSTANWSATSGGPNGASVPTVADNVIFDQAATYTVIMTGALACLNFTVTNGTVTFNTGSFPSLTVRGSFTLRAGGTWNMGFTITFDSPTAATITTNGVSFATSSPPLVFNSPTGSWTLGSALTTGNNGITLTAGTLDTAGYAVTTGTINAGNNAVRTLTLGASTVTVTGNTVNFGGTNLTLNAGTSTISVGGPTVNMSIGSPITLYDFSITSASFSTFTINGTCTYNNFSVVASTSNAPRTISFGGDQTVNGTFTVSAPANATRRTNIFSATIGISRTLTINSFSGADINFRDIAVVGAAAPISGTRFGNCSRNSGITFNAPKTIYWNFATGGAWSSTAWASISGGSPDINNFPLPQDTAVFEATGLNSGATITIDQNWDIGAIDMSARTVNTMILATGSNIPTIYGNWTGGTGVTISGTNTLNFFGSSQNLNTAGVAFTQPIAVDNVNGVLVLLSAVTLPATRFFQLQSGTLNLNGYTLTSGTFSLAATTTRTIAFGSGNITVIGTGTVFFLNPTNFSRTGTPTINISNNSATATTVTTGAVTEAQALDFNYTTGSYLLTDTSARYRSVNLTGFSGTYSNITRTYFGGFNAGSTATISAGITTQTFAATSGTWDITSNGRTLDFPITFNGVGGQWRLQDALNAPSGITLTAGTFNLNGFTCTTVAFASNNSNVRTIAFGTGQISLTGNANVIWDTTTATNLSFTGTFRVVSTYTGGVGQRSINQGFVSEAAVQPISTTGSSGFILDTSSTDTKSLTGSWNNFDMTGVTGTLANGARTVYGNFNAGSTVTLTSGSNATTFASTSGVRTITTNGRTLDFPLTFNGIGGTWQLQDALTMGTSWQFSLTAGTFNANNYNVTIGTMSSSLSNVRTLALGSGTWTVNGNGTSAWNFSTSNNATITGTATISMTSATAKTFAGGGRTWPTLNQGGAGALTISGNNTFTDITSTRTATGPCTITLTASSTQTLTNLTSSGTSPTNLLTFNSSTNGTRANLVVNNDVNLSFTSLRDNGVSGGFRYSALLTNGNVNVSNNAGWQFSLGGGSFISFFF